eukprot:4811746-Alexandrium_andersonii.AAC.1
MLQAVVVMTVATPNHGTGHATNGGGRIDVYGDRAAGHDVAADGAAAGDSVRHDDGHDDDHDE